METNDMKIMRKYRVVLSGLLFVSLIIASFGSIRADNPPGNPYSVYGYVTLNGKPAPDSVTDNVTVILSIPNRANHSGRTHDNGKYTVDFDAAQGETANFTVYVNTTYFYNQYVRPMNTPSFTIMHPSPHGYFINLSVNATQNQGENGSGGGGGGGGGGGSEGTSNALPVADAGGPYQGLVGEPISFNGSGSYDSDGSIKFYNWTFGDGNIGTGKTVTHIYTAAKSYNVVLMVTDNQGATDDDSATVTITLANLPPSAPILDGPTTGPHNNSYTYTATSTDPENSTLTYTFTWGDGMTNTSIATTSGTPVTMYHAWRHAGVYTLSVTAFDGETMSTPTTITVLMSVMWVDGLGYLIDYNGDGIYDAFYSNATGKTTLVQRLADGTYLIDSDGDGVWDHQFNHLTKDLTLYTLPPVGGGGVNGIWVLAGILGAILVLFLILLLLTRRSKKKQESETTTAPEPKSKGKAGKKK